MADNTDPEIPHMPLWEVDLPEQLEAATPLPEPAPSASHAPVRTAAAEPAVEAPPPLVRLVEALLFVGGPPLTAARAAEAVRGLGADEFQDAVDALNRSYRAQGRPYLVQAREQGYVLALRPRFAFVREKLHGGVREVRLSQAAVDVLALVAYHQPATRRDIDSRRGADSASLLRLLVRHGLVALQRGADKEGCYVTTQRFLDLFHLRSLDDLPQTQDLQRL